MVVAVFFAPAKTVRAAVTAVVSESTVSSTVSMIKLKTTTIQSLSGGNKAFTVKWKKQTKNVTGYQIQYSLKKGFKSGNKMVTIRKANAVSKKVSGLKAGKTYYVRVRTFYADNGTKKYSKWSAAKAVKTKKTAASTRSVATSVSQSTSKSASKAKTSSRTSSGGSTVYITDTGSKYHADGCRYLSKSKHAIGLNDAISRGLSPCSVCLK